MRIMLITIVALLFQCAVWAGEIETFRAYVDTDLCSRLMVGSITPSRIECSQKTSKDRAESVLVQLSNNLIFAVNKEKMLQPLVGKFAEASGETKVKSGTMKLQSIKEIDASTIPADDPDRRLLDANRNAKMNPETWEKLRHELAMMPYITYFDFISFNLSDMNVILTGWTVRQTNRDDAFYIASKVKGVETVVNNIEILPLGSFDMQIRSGVSVALQRFLPRYFWRSGSNIKIIVKNGQVTLVGTVASKTDSDLANIQANGVRGVFKVFNLLRVESSTKK
jgi:hyperosmotically inducible periplasmic protein